MIDPITRRGIVGHVLAAGTAAIPLIEPNDKNIRYSAKYDGMGNNPVALGLFLQAGGTPLPSDCNIVWTSGHSRIAIGAASYIYHPAVDARYVILHPKTSFLDAQGRGFRLNTQRVDVIQAGAFGDGKSDDTAAIQEALNIVDAAGGGVVVLPVGEYRITSALELPPRVGIQGYGQQSLLRAHGSNGIALLPSDLIGPRRLSDFSIQGVACEHTSAIFCDIAEDKRVQGLVFENIYISFFGTAIKGRGFWHTSFRTISIHQVWRGFYLYDRNVKITIDDCRITQGGLLEGQGVSIGIQIGDGNSKFRPEDVQIEKSIVYGFDKAIVWRTALFGGVTNCDLDSCTKTGLELVTADGGFTFRDNWVEVDGDAVRGVDCTAIGYDPGLTNVTIANNRINANNATGDSCGIALGNRQADIVVDGNSIGGQFNSGIRARGVRRLSLLNNKVVAGISAEQCIDLTIAHNYAGKGLILVSNVGLAAQGCFGPHSGRIVGTIVMPAGKSTQTATFRSLRLPDLPVGTYGTALTLGNSSGQSRGDLRGRITRTGIVVDVQQPSSEPGEISFQIEIY